MTKKEHIHNLVLKGVKTLVVLFTLAAIGWLIGVLPFAADLPFISTKLPASVFFSSVLWALGIYVFVMFGVEISPSVDALLDFMPKAGMLGRNIIKILATLFAYDAFQAAVYPFIPGYEWLYQSVFLGFSLFFLAKAGLLIYAASEQIGGFILGVMNPYQRPAAQKADPTEKQ